MPQGETIRGSVLVVAQSRKILYADAVLDISTELDLLAEVAAPLLLLPW